MSSSNWWLTLGAVLAGLAVGAGAFAAHGLDRHFHVKYAGRNHEKKFTLDGSEPLVVQTPLAAKFLADFKTGAEYQMYHALALLAVGLLATNRPSKLLTISGCLFLVGIAGFSGGLYAYTLSGVKWIGMFVVPAGGLSFIAGWCALAAVVCPCRKSPA